MKVFPQLGSK